MKLRILNLFLFLSFLALQSTETFTYPQLLIKIPTRSRPEQFFKILDAYYKKLSGAVTYHFLISCDAHDETMNNQHVIEKLKKYKHLSFYFGDSKTKIEAYNCDIDKHKEFDVLLVVSDDMEPVMDQYDALIINTMRQYFPDLDGVLNFHDGNVGERCNTLPILGKKYFDRFGYIYHPSYKSLFCDEELTVVSRMLGKEAVIYQTIIKHNHPDYDSRYVHDALYKHNQTFFAEDEKNFYERQKRTFDLDDAVLKQSMQKKWSILITALEKNKSAFEAIYVSLQSQIQDLNLQDQIEILASIDAGGQATGFKRNALIRQSHGEYISFVQDTDVVDNTYIHNIFNRMHHNPDCINPQGKLIVQGEREQIIEGFTHRSVIKRYIASQFLFPKTYNKDYEQWINHIQESGFIKTQEAIAYPQYYITQEKKKNKIVGLVQIRNESVLIEQCLHALSLYTDAIVVLDDASDDNTVAICQSVAQHYRVECIIQNSTSAWENRTESDNRQKLLDAGRAIGGTHFIILDADEMMTANCAQHNYLRSLILQLNPGDRLKMNIVHFWNSLERYRIYFNEKMKYFIFCDDGSCFYDKKFLHVDRVPLNLSGGANLEFGDSRYALIHFGYVNWQNVLIRQAWYKCLERVRSPHKLAAEINSWYPAHKEKDFETYPVHENWLAGYAFFDAHLFGIAEQWRCKQIVGWFDTYGMQYFNDLEIWYVDWNEIRKRNTL